MTQKARLDAEKRPWMPDSFFENQNTGEENGVREEPRAFVIFQLGGQWLAVNVTQVREILDNMTVTPLPRAPHDVEGMIDVRGSGVCVIDLSSHLGLRGVIDKAAERIVVFEFARNGKSPLPIGVRTETVRDVTQISESDIERAPQAMQDWDHTLIEGIARIDDLIVVLVDLEAVLSGSPGANRDIYDFS
jgi:purine-binding chemotaxis protein CheW